jgi:phage-related protein
MVVDPRQRLERRLTAVVKYDNNAYMSLTTRPISWLKPALKEFQSFPAAAKPLLGFGPGVMEIALRHRGDAFRVVYALQLGPDLIVVHAFQKKSKRGVETPKAELDLVRERLRRLRAG